MTTLFNFLSHQLQQLFGYIVGYFSFLYNYFVQFIAYSFVCLYRFIIYTASYFIILVLYVFDLFLQFVVYTVNLIFGGDVFGVVGLSTSVIEDNLQSILTIAPYAKMIAYILNLDALVNAFNYFVTFILIWLVYRWFARWVRG